MKKTFAATLSVIKIMTFIALEQSPAMAAQELNVQRRDPSISSPQINALFQSTPHSDRLGSGKLGLKDVRIMIFPHLGPYATPQKRETKLKTIQFENPEGCKLIVKGRLRRENTHFSFNFDTLPSAVKLECKGITKVVREEGLTSYSYQGDFVISKAKTESTDHLEVVNHLTFDQYLKGVVPTEVPADWPEETLKAQAIAARTYALWEILSFRAENPNWPQTARYDLDDTVATQAYVGRTKATDATDQAVDQTEGLVMTYQAPTGELNVVKAYFHADSGGYTENAENVWGGPPLSYCRGKKEVYDWSLLKSDWERKIDSASLGKMVLGAGTSRKISKIKVASRYPLGRTKEITYKAQSVFTKKISGFDFRYKTKLRSTWWQVTADGTGNYTFKGRGFGHGVGMNQWGAKVLADSMGWTYDKILNFYYDGIKIESLSR